MSTFYLTLSKESKTKQLFDELLSQKINNKCGKLSEEQIAILLEEFIESHDRLPKKGEIFKGFKLGDYVHKQASVIVREIADTDLVSQFSNSSDSSELFGKSKKSEESDIDLFPTSSSNSSDSSDFSEEKDNHKDKNYVDSDNSVSSPFIARINWEKEFSSSSSSGSNNNDGNNHNYNSKLSGSSSKSSSYICSNFPSVTCHQPSFIPSSFQESFNESIEEGEIIDLPVLQTQNMMDLFLKFFKLKERTPYENEKFLGVNLFEWYNENKEECDKSVEPLMFSKGQKNYNNLGKRKGKRGPGKYVSPEEYQRRVEYILNFVESNKRIPKNKDNDIYLEIAGFKIYTFFEWVGGIRWEMNNPIKRKVYHDLSKNDLIRKHFLKNIEKHGDRGRMSAIYKCGDGVNLEKKSTKRKRERELSDKDNFSNKKKKM